MIDVLKNFFVFEKIPMSFPYPFPQYHILFQALFIKEYNPKLNTREEFKGKKLTAIKWVLDSLFTREEGGLKGK